MKIITILLFILVSYGAFNFFTKAEKKSKKIFKLTKKEKIKKTKRFKNRTIHKKKKQTVIKKDKYTNEKATALQIYDKLNYYDDINPYLEGIRKELNYNVVSMLREIRVNLKNNRDLSVTLLRKVKKLSGDDLDTILMFEPDYDTEQEQDQIDTIDDNMEVETPEYTEDESEDEYEDGEFDRPEGFDDDDDDDDEDEEEYTEEEYIEEPQLLEPDY